jgi:hypothetical protein
MFNKFYEKASEQNGATAKQSSSPTKAKKKRRRRRKGNHDNSAEPSSSSTRVDAAGTKRKSPSAALVPPPSAQSKRRRRQAPSEEALALSAKLKEFSSQKRLDEALDLYWNGCNDSLRDGHHACIVVDCSARCGCIAVSTPCTEQYELAAPIVSNFLSFFRKEKRLWMK